jgi:hypothetical protein
MGKGTLVVSVQVPIETISSMGRISSDKHFLVTCKHGDTFGTLADKIKTRFPQKGGRPRIRLVGSGRDEWFHYSDRINPAFTWVSPDSSYITDVIEGVVETPKFNERKDRDDWEAMGNALSRMKKGKKGKMNAIYDSDEIMWIARLESDVVYE